MRHLRGTADMRTLLNWWQPSWGQHCLFMFISEVKNTLQWSLH